MGRGTDPHFDATNVLTVLQYTLEAPKLSSAQTHLVLRTCNKEMREAQKPVNQII
jgi:hypothetical protein